MLMIKRLDNINFTAKLFFLVLPVAVALIGLLSWLAYISSLENELDEKIGILNGLRGDIMMAATISAQYASAVENQISDTVMVKRMDIEQTLSRILSQQNWITLNMPDLAGSINEITDQNKVITEIVLPDQDIADESGLLSDMAQDVYKLIEAHSLSLNQEKAALNNRFGMKEMIIVATAVFLFVVILVFLMANRITKPINQAVHAMMDIAEGEGDLTQRLTVTSQDELGKLTSGFNTFIDMMQELILNIRDTMSHINTASDEIVKGSSHLSDRTNNQTSFLHQTSSSITEMAVTVSQNAESSKDAKDLAINAQTQAQKGGEIINKAVNAMKEVDESSSKMADIIETINGIAFQTNLLALNAAVEAARAGDQGNGFAVVANEVRNLSLRSAEAAEEIKSLITNSIDKIKSGSTLVNESGEILSEIVNSTNKVSQIILGISDASQEQADGIGAINDAILQMEVVTQQNAALVEEFTATTSSTKKEINSLSRYLDTFKVDSSNEILPANGQAVDKPRQIARK